MTIFIVKIKVDFLVQKNDCVVVAPLHFNKQQTRKVDLERLVDTWQYPASCDENYE